MFGGGCTSFCAKVPHLLIRCEVVFFVKFHEINNLNFLTKYSNIHKILLIFMVY